MQRNNSPLETAQALLEFLRTITGGFVIAHYQTTSAKAKSDQTHSTTPSSPTPIVDVSAASMPETPRSPQRNFRLQLPQRTQPESIFSTDSEFTTAQSLEELYERIHTCTKCPLGNTRTKFVFGSGNPRADIVFIGEAPGADEDLQGEPFVGRAGQLLTKILAAIELAREDVYICNIIKCRPPGNRRPLPTEVEQCVPYLYKQLELINPQFVVALGLTAAETLLQRKLRMHEARGRWYDFYGARLLVTYHPAALLRNPELKRDTWEDMKRLRAAYNEYRSTGILPDSTG